ncbi:MAG: hypothetical protein LBC20_03445 [Planctomycetaceae bacterium]|nr:hypothetical protein [Planctomycetaceae bacterium]
MSDLHFLHCRILLSFTPIVRVHYGKDFVKDKGHLFAVSVVLQSIYLQKNFKEKQTMRKKENSQRWGGGGQSC